jgi:hypothetical protein
MILKKLQPPYGNLCLEIRSGLKYEENRVNTKFSCKFSTFWISLANGEISAAGQWICNSRNYHFFGNGHDHCYPNTKKHIFEWPNRAIKPKWNGRGDVVGCGLVLSPNNQLAIFFTGNGILMGQFL